MAAEKFLQHDAAGGLREVQGVTTGGAPGIDKIPSLNASGLLDISMMPPGLGGDVAVLPAVGAIAAGDLVNVYNNGGTPSVRKADASAIGTIAHGFVLSAYADAENATVYFEGNNTGVSGLTAGKVFLSATTAGLSTNTAPTGTGKVVQSVGVAVSATQINFEAAPAILLA